ncbi:hypothetical protein [Streptomyces sp. NPDC056987]|uniref:hypothetical protein n=1 Tax=Streptomyces sp. NPDC056987 TaxID=3345988 RepID=UPI00363C10D3
MTDPVVSATVQLRAAELAGQLGGQWNYLTTCGPDATQIKALLIRGQEEGWWHFEVACATDGWRDA